LKAKIEKKKELKKKPKIKVENKKEEELVLVK
jgi:hypothetical protein